MLLQLSSHQGKPGESKGEDKGGLGGIRGIKGIVGGRSEGRGRKHRGKVGGSYHGIEGGMRRENLRWGVERK